VQLGSRRFPLDIIGEDTMAIREMTLCFALSGLTATAIAQTMPTPETWTPIGRPAQTVTGRVTFTPSEITFQNRKSLPLAAGGQMLFRPEVYPDSAEIRKNPLANRA
jgi:hypothetical protein